MSQTRTGTGLNLLSSWCQTSALAGKGMMYLSLMLLQEVIHLLVKRLGTSGLL